jgi:pyruvate dehydrogenase E1 component alpha subunit
MKVAKSDQISCVFHGDAVVETGVFFESVNFAVVKKLPVLFICENNLYSVYSPLHVRQPEGRSIAAMVSGLGMPSCNVDGNDAAKVYDKVCSAVAEIRSGGGPRLLEFSTYRWLEHCGPSFDNHIGYRSESEFLEWKAKEPIARFEKEMLENSTITTEELQLMNENIALEVEEAFNFAEESPMPEADTAYTGLYCELPAIGPVSQSEGK